MVVSGTNYVFGGCNKYVSVIYWAFDEDTRRKTVFLSKPFVISIATYFFGPRLFDHAFKDLRKTDLPDSQDFVRMSRGLKETKRIF